MTEEKKWLKVSTDMGYNTNAHKHIPNLLRAHYERILYPYDVFQREEERKQQVKSEEAIKEENNGAEADEQDDCGPEEKEYKPHNIPGRMGMKVRENNVDLL